MSKNLLLSLFFFTCLASIAKEKNLSRQEYVNKYADIAMQEMRRTGVPASITLAQGCLESGNGNSKLAKKSNNHFGIKCHKDWKGKTTRHDDDQKNECFRVYKNPEQSFIDHSDFLVNGNRYDFLFELKPTDYKGWAKGLRKAGYATNPKYSKLLITIIEESELYKYDEKALGRKFARKQTKKNVATDNSETAEEGDPIALPVLADIDSYSFDSPIREVFENNRCRYIVVQKGDTFYSLAREYDLMEWQLYAFNDMGKSDILKAGQILYLQTKKNRPEKKYVKHTVRKGETLSSISQLYAMKKKKIVKYNRLSGDSINEGEILRLRK